jgi:hypothetical protein
MTRHARNLDARQAGWVGANQNDGLIHGMAFLKTSNRLRADESCALDCTIRIDFPSLKPKLFDFTGARRAAARRVALQSKIFDWNTTIKT